MAPISWKILAPLLPFPRKYWHYGSRFLGNTGTTAPISWEILAPQLPFPRKYWHYSSRFSGNTGTTAPVSREILPSLLPFPGKYCYCHTGLIHNYFHLLIFIIYLTNVAYKIFSARRSIPKIKTRDCCCWLSHLCLNLFLLNSLEVVGEWERESRRFPNTTTFLLLLLFCFLFFFFSSFILTATL